MRINVKTALWTTTPCALLLCVWTASLWTSAGFDFNGRPFARWNKTTSAGLAFIDRGLIYVDYDPSHRAPKLFSIPYLINDTWLPRDLRASFKPPWWYLRLDNPITIKCVFPFYILAIPTAIGSCLIYRRMMWRLKKAGHCACGYNLVGITSKRCPECGKPIIIHTHCKENVRTATQSPAPADSPPSARYDPSPSRSPAGSDPPARRESPPTP